MKRYTQQDILDELEQIYQLHRQRIPRKHISANSELETAILCEFGCINLAFESLIKRLMSQGNTEDAIKIQKRGIQPKKRQIGTLYRESGIVPECLRPKIEELPEQERRIFLGVYFECRTVIDLSDKYGISRKDTFSQARNTYLQVLEESVNVDRRDLNRRLFTQYPKDKLLEEPRENE